MTRLPYPEDDGRTHYDGCWAMQRHHNCAVQEVDRLRELVVELCDALDDRDQWGTLLIVGPLLERARKAAAP